MNVSLEELKELAVKVRQHISTDADYALISTFGREMDSTLKKKKIPLNKKIEWAEKEYYINLFLQPSEEESLDRIVWEYWGSPEKYMSDLIDADMSMRKVAYGSFFDRYNQPTFEEFKNGATLRKEATTDTSAMAL